MKLTTNGLTVVVYVVFRYHVSIGSGKTEHRMQSSRASFIEQAILFQVHLINLHDMYYS